MKVLELERFYLEPQLASEAYFNTRGGSDWVELAQIKEKMQKALANSDADVVIIEVRGDMRNPRPMYEGYVPREDHIYEREYRKGCYVAYRNDRAVNVIWEELHGYECVGVDNCVYLDDHPAYLLSLMFEKETAA